MNFYEFCKKYLENQTSTYLKGFDLKELPKYYEVPMMYLNFFSIKPGFESKNDILKIFALILITPSYSFIPLEKCYDDLCLILDDFNPNHVSRLDEINLYKLIKTYVEPLIKYYFLFEYAFEKFSKNIISAAKYMVENFVDFPSYIKHIRSNPKTIVEELTQISGMGELSAKKFLAYIGCFEYFYRDLRTIEVFKGFDKNVVNEKTFNKAIYELAGKCNTTTYALNAMIKLIVNGIYYMHLDDSNSTIKIWTKHKKDKFIKAINQALEDDTLTL